MMDSLISIIIPVYNVEKYLKKCIDSVCNQTYKNIEIILVDDGSTDSSGKICDEYAGIDGRIKVVHKENGGLSDARNTGIENASGKLIAFIDSDDYVSQSMIDLLYKKLSYDNSDIALCGVAHINENGEIVNNSIESLSVYDGVLTADETMYKLCSPEGGYYSIICNKLFKKELFDGIRFPLGKINEDEFVVHELFGKCSKISCINTKMYFHVLHSGSIMHQPYSIKNLDKVEAYVNRTKFLLKRNLFECAFCFLSAVANNLSIAYLNLDMHEKDVKKRFTELKKSYNKLYLKSFVKIIRFSSITKFLNLTCFFISHKINSRILKIFKKDNN